MAAKSDLCGKPLQEYEKSIFACTENGFLKNPDQLAVVSRSQPADHLSDMVQCSTGKLPSRISDSCLRWTYAEYFGTGVNLAAGLSPRVPTPNSIMVTFIPNSVEWLLLLSSSIMAKFGVAFLDIDMLQKPRQAELETRLVQLRPFSIVVADGAGASAIDDALQRPKVVNSLVNPLKISLATPVPLTNGKRDGWRHFATLCEPRDASILAKVVDDARYDDPNRTAMVIYTSGTSGGMPKGCVRDVAGTAAWTKQQRFASINHTQRTFRLIHTANFRAIAPVITLISWRDGATVVLSTYPFQSRTYLDDVDQENITELVLIPAQLYAVAEDPTLRSRHYDSLKLVLVSGDIVTSEVFRLCKRTFPHAKVRNLHGMTEAGAMFDWPYPADLDSIPFHHGISPVGHIAPATRIRILSPTGETVPRGKVGDLHVQSRTTFQKYLRQQTDTPEIYNDETGRWFKTGDVAMVNDAGDIYIVGRSKDVIKRAGVSIAPSTIESCLQAYIGSQTVVVGKPHPTLGQEPFAIVEDFKGKSINEIRAHVIAVCGRDSQLGGAADLTSLGFASFPINLSGKIQRTDLIGPVEEYIAVH